MFGLNKMDILHILMLMIMKKLSKWLRKALMEWFLLHKFGVCSVYIIMHYINTLSGDFEDSIKLYLKKNICDKLQAYAPSKFKLSCPFVCRLK